MRSVVALILFVSSCAHRPDFNLTEEQIYERNKKWREENAKTEAERAGVKKPGSTYDAFIKVWGKPSFDEFVDGVHYLRYDNEVPPMIYSFKDNKLIGWQSNSSLEKERATIAEKRYQEEREAKKEREQKVQSAFKQIGRTKRGKSETTECRQVGNTTTCTSE